MRDRQHLAVEKACGLFSKEPQHIPTLLGLLQHLSETDANTVAALFSSTRITPRNGLDWLQNYFALPPGNGDQHFIELPDTKKSQLLAAFSDGADYLIWKLNNLHAVTDDYGSEISTGTLVNSSEERLLEIFEKLHPAARQHYETRFRAALTTKQRYAAADILKDATARARKTDRTGPQFGDGVHPAVAWQRTLRLFFS